MDGKPQTGLHPSPQLRRVGVYVNNIDFNLSIIVEQYAV